MAIYVKAVLRGQSAFKLEKTTNVQLEQSPATLSACIQSVTPEQSPILTPWKWTKGFPKGVVFQAPFVECHFSYPPKKEARSLPTSSSSLGCNPSCPLLPPRPPRPGGRRPRASARAMAAAQLARPWASSCGASWASRARSSARDAPRAMHRGGRRRLSSGSAEFVCWVGTRLFVGDFDGEPRGEPKSSLGGVSRKKTFPNGYGS